MKKLKIISYCWVLSLMGCDDLDIGPRYQMVPITRKKDTTLYCYRINWALDAQMTFISTNDVCSGLHSDQGIYFGKGEIQVFYDIKGDTIDIYTDVAPKIPRNFPFVVRINLLDKLSWKEYERRSKDGLVNKVKFDTVVYKLPCNMTPDTSRWSM